MEKLPRRQPAAQQNIVGMVFDALADMMEGIPIIGDILGFVSSLFGNSRATNARVLRIEQTLSQGSKGFDDFNRGNSESSLGKHSSMTSNWVQGGDGEVLGIRDRAANVKQFITPAAGRRWAKFPSPASQNKQAASVVCAERNNANNACTSLMICADTGFTEFVYANVFGAGGIRLGRGTRSGNSWTFTQWASSNYRIGTAETLELQSDGAGTYKVIVEGDVVLTWVDTSSFPIDAAHRFCGFAIQTWTGILAVPQYGWGVEAFSIRSEADTYTAIETVETVANGAATTAGNAATAAEAAQQAADNAVDTAVTEATNAATGAVAGAVSGAIAPVKNQVEAVQASVITFQEGLPLRPFSHSMTNSEMTFDRVLLQPRLTGVSLSGAVSSTNLGTHRHRYDGRNDGSIEYTDTESLGSHTHTHNFAVSTSTSNSTFTPAANTITAGFIRATWGGLRESFTFATGPVTSPCPMQVMIGRLDPTNGNVVILWVSAELTAVIGSGSGEFVVTIPDGVLIEDRETIFVGIHQYGSGGIRPLYGITLAGLQRDGLLHPAKPNTRFGRSTAMTAGTTLSAGSLDFSNDTLPWLGIGPSLVIPVPAPTAYYENFDGNVMPSALVYRGGIRAQVSNGVFVVSGSTDGEANYLYTRRLNRDDHAVESKLMAVNSRPSFLAVRSDSSGNRIVMAVNEDSVSIRRRDSSGATLASVSMAVAAGTTFRFSAVGNVYTASRLDANGQAVTLCQYVDSSNVLARGVDNRYVGIGVDRFFLVNSGGWDYLRAADYPDPE